MNSKKNNTCKFMGVMRTLICTCWILVFLLFCPIESAAATAYDFAGAGTEVDPYLIESTEDLKNFRDLVNGGNTFENVWFLQTEDIDLHSEEWTPIGEFQSGHYFYGIYNGGGHVLRNLKITNGGYAGFFGQLAGVVLNLGIESGSIDGDCVGSIASHSLAEANPAIIQCYSRADVSGKRVGGIADDFSGGRIIRCWFDGSLEGEVTGNIVSYSGELIECYDEMEEISRFQVLIPHEKSEEEIVTLEAQKYGYAAFTACQYVDYESVIPWVWDGDGLRFSRERLQKPSINLAGSGTKEDPYLITSFADLSHFRDLVNVGYGFEGCRFVQTADITAQTDDWIPIGIYGTGNYFWGVYDGAGHIIDGLRCQWHGGTELDNHALFGQVGGVVANLGLEDVYIEGKFIGTIASHAAGTNRTAAILNCYASGVLIGDRMGGIADNFHCGTIANCISDVKLYFYNADRLSDSQIQEFTEIGTGGITSMSADTKVYGCRTTAQQVMPEAYRTATSSVIEPDVLKQDSFFRSLNIRTGLTQALFANAFDVELRQWEKSDDRMIGFSSHRQSIQIVSVINEYLMPLVLGILLLFALWEARRAPSFQALWHRKSQTIVAIAVISGVVSFFVDCAAIGVARDCLSMGKILFILLINGTFAASAALIVRFSNFKLRWKDINWLLLGLMAVLLVLELLQFDTVPRYDAGLYYGSLARGAKLFRLDLLTYIGAFVCWKWIQGTALLLAPLEFLMPGKMVGVYAVNAVITLVTVVLLYRLYRECLPQISRTVATISSFLLVLCPFQLGMFTYLCLDSHCVYYAIWLLYAYKRKNALLTAFCGYLLFFSKISGGVFYVIFLITATAVVILKEYRGNLLHRIISWWDWRRCILWMMPAVLYLASMIWGEALVIQHFNGSYIVQTADKLPAAYGNTLIQTFVFGLRWLFVLLIGLSLVALLRNRDEKLLGISHESLGILIGTVAAGIAVVCLLLLYNGDAECPRYTALANVVYVVLAPVAIGILFRKENLRCIAASLLCALLLVQTYWTIDPSIWLRKSAIDTGVKNLYRLSLSTDTKPGMNLGRYYSRGYNSVGDIYAYNLEYNFIDGLLQQAMCEIEPDENDKFYVLDVIDYEYHLQGSQYTIYWNTEKKHFTYDGSDPNSIVLNVYAAISDTLVSRAGNDLNMGSDFYLVVSHRVDDADALYALEKSGYTLTKLYQPKNMHGTMRIYHFER